jgi:LysM repeat protein
MYAKGNRPLDTFTPMGEENLDASKTWCLIENLIASQRVQYIFLDRRVQRVLYEYALTRGYDQAYLERVFGNVRGSLIQHVRNHVDHMHVRFFTPWSTLAAHIGPDETEKQSVIEIAQQSYLPSKVNYYVNGSEKGLDELARSFGVTQGDLCRWNHISPSAVPVPGSCLVFYKRSFESEPVLLARSLQPGFIAQAPAVRMASLRREPEPASVFDSTPSAEPEPIVKEKKSGRSPTPGFRTYKAKKGDTLEKIARRNKLDVKLLCQLNGIKKTAPLRSGQRVKTGAAKIYADAGHVATDARQRGSSSSSICFASDSKKPDSPTAAYYTVNRGGTLHDVSKKTGIPLSSLCQLNGLGRNAHLKPGQRIKLTQANLPVKPSFGSASCSIQDSAKKPAAVKSDKKSSKPSEAKAARKTAAKAGASKSIAKEKSKPAAKAKGSAKPAAAKGNVKPAASAKAAAGKPALKQTGKSGKRAPATDQKKTPGTKSGSSKSKVKTAAKPGKNTTLAKR